MQTVAQRAVEIIDAEPVSTTLTPMSMLDKAVAAGASIEVLERLMGLQGAMTKAGDAIIRESVARANTFLGQRAQADAQGGG